MPRTKNRPSRISALRTADELSRYIISRLPLFAGVTETDLFD